MEITIKINGQEWQINDDMLINPDDFISAGTYNPNACKPFLICNEYGPLLIVFGDNQSDVLDIAVDANRLDSCLISPEAHAAMGVAELEDVSYLGNACKPFNLTGITIHELPLPAFSFCALLQAHCDQISE